MDQLALERLCSRAILVDLKGQVGMGEPIRLGQLREGVRSTGITGLRGLSLVIRTGWGEERYGGQDYYQDNPHLSVEAAQWVASEGFNLVGLDFPPDGIGKEMVVPAPSPIHKTFLGAGVCILENLTNLEKLPERVFELLCLPIKLEGHGGGPARVLARAWHDPA